MTKLDKLIAKFKKSPKDFSYDELNKLLENLGFSYLNSGKTGGSRCKFYHQEKNLIINLHKPHPSPYLKTYVINQIKDKLAEEGLI